MDQHPTGDHADTPPPPPTLPGVPSDPRTGDPDRHERRPDPGTPRSRSIAFWLALVLFVLVAFSQNYEAIFGSPELLEEPALAAPSRGDPLVAGGRAGVGIREMLKGRGVEPGGMAESMLLPKVEPGTPPAERLRLIILRAELESISAVDTELAALRQELQDADPQTDEKAEQRPDPAADPESDPEQDEQADERPDPRAELLRDIDTVDRIWGQGVQRVDPEELDRFSDRHGWFASLAMVIGEPDDASAREAMLDDAHAFAVRLLLAAGAGLGLVGLGLVCFLVVVYLLTTRRIRARFVAPLPGGSVYLEMLPLFLLCFIGVGLVQALMQAVGMEVPISVTAALQWSLLAVVFWPLLRGVAWARARSDLGIVAPRGITREIFCGVFGYLAGIPLLLLGMGLSLVVMSIWQAVAGEPPTVHNPIADQIAQAGTLELVLLFSLATLWAPVVEELVFRGGMYRHMRGRYRVLLSAIVVGLVFTLVHAYGPAGVPVLLALAVTFALLREWRGSIIASMTAHFMHNSLVLTVMYFVLFS